ncbi:MAG: DUF2799 domain-containing protein [Rhizobiaceae bacterium]
MNFPTKYSFLLTLIFLAAALGVLQACVMTKHECRTSDWHQVGLSDGAHGKPHSMFGKYVKACKKASVAPDEGAWLAGHKRGARQYCTPAYGFLFGRNGHAYHGICEPDQEPAFLQVYLLGVKEYRLKSRVSSVESSIDSLESEMDGLSDQVEKGKLSKDEARFRRGSLVSRIREAAKELAEAEQDLTRFKEQLLRDGYVKMSKS